MSPVSSWVTSGLSSSRPLLFFPLKWPGNIRLSHTRLFSSHTAETLPCNRYQATRPALVRQHSEASILLQTVLALTLSPVKTLSLLRLSWRLCWYYLAMRSSIHSFLPVSNRSLILLSWPVLSPVASPVLLTSPSPPVRYQLNKINMLNIFKHCV